MYKLHTYIVCMYVIIYYHTQENFGRGEFGKLIVSHSPKFSLPRFADTWKPYMAYALTVAYSPNFSLPIDFTYMVRQNFPLPNISCVRYMTYMYIYVNGMSTS